MCNRKLKQCVVGGSLLRACFSSFSLFNLHRSDAQITDADTMDAPFRHSATTSTQPYSCTYSMYSYQSRMEVHTLRTSETNSPRSSPNSNSDRSDTPHGSKLDVAGNPCKVRAPAPRTSDSGMVRPISEVAVCFVFSQCFPAC